MSERTEKNKRYNVWSLRVLSFLRVLSWPAFRYIRMCFGPSLIPSQVDQNGPIYGAIFSQYTATYDFILMMVRSVLLHPLNSPSTVSIRTLSFDLGGECPNKVVSPTIVEKLTKFKEFTINYDGNYFE